MLALRFFFFSVGNTLAINMLIITTIIVFVFFFYAWLSVYGLDLSIQLVSWLLVLINVARNSNWKVLGL